MQDDWRAKNGQDPIQGDGRLKRDGKRSQGRADKSIQCLSYFLVVVVMVIVVVVTKADTTEELGAW